MAGKGTPGSIHSRVMAAMKGLANPSGLVDQHHESS
jgi:hypothetical protein